MRKGMMCVLALMALLTLLEPVVTAPTVAAPAALEETGVYEEDFTAYTFKDYAKNIEWDIWQNVLRLSRLDGADQGVPGVAVTLPDGSVFVVWQGFADIHAQKLDANGNQLWVDDARVNSDSAGARQWSPAVAADGSGSAVVVWRDNRNGIPDIYAQKLDANGNKSWAADVRVNSENGASDQDEPAVAVDGDGNAVVVWRDNHNGSDIYAQKLGVNGSKLWAADVRVNSESGAADREDPAVAVDGSGNGVVVWQDGRNGGGNDDIYAQKLDAGGNRLWTTDVRVNSDGRTVNQFDPAVAVDGDGDAIVVWEDGLNNGDIYAQKLGGNGNKLWAHDVRVNSESETSRPYRASVAVGRTGNIVVVWRDERNGDRDIYAQKLGASGDRLWTGDVRVNSGSGSAVQHSPAVAVDGDRCAIIVWEDTRKGDKDIYAQKVDARGNRLWTADMRVDSDHGTAYPCAAPAMAVDRRGNAVVAWEDSRNGAADIYAQKVDGSGNRVWTADVRVNSDSGLGQYYPAIAVDINGNALVVWKDDRNAGDTGDIYAQKLDASGNRLWTIDMRINSDSGTAVQWRPAVAVDRGGNAVITWQDDRNGSTVDIYAQKLDAGGNRLWTTDVCVNLDSRWAVRYSDTIAVDGSGNAVVAWWDWDTDAIYAQKLDANGNRLWTTDVRVDSGSRMPWSSPTVTVDGDGDAVFVWGVARNGNDDIYAQKLDASGNLLWSDEVRINSDGGTANQLHPTAAMDDSGDVIAVWEDYRNGNPDIHAQKINSVGGKGWLADLRVVYPDRFHLSTGSAQSHTVDTIADNVAQATLTANYQPNGGEVQFYLTNNGGAHWAEVTPGVTHVFTTTGSDLRWRAVLTADPVWLRTPVVNSLRIEYSNQNPYADDYEPDDTCAQASPLQVNGAVQGHTFHQPDDEDWAWFDVVAGTTYVLQTAHAGPNADTVLELHDICDHPIMTDTNAFGHDARLIFTTPSDAVFYARVTNQDGSVYGEDTDYDLSVRTYHPNGLAVIVAGHNDAWQLQSNIDYTADQAYLTLLEAGFPRANVRYLGPNPNRDADGNGVDDDIAATATITNVRWAVQDWPREQGLALGMPFYVYLMDHGHYDQFLANGNAEKVTAPLLDLWLSNLEATTGADQITVVIDACKSGSFIDVTGPGPAEISGLNRVIVASTTSQANAYPSERGALFSDAFWTALGDNQDVWSAYRTAKAAVDARGLMQTPWLDDNGDAVADGEDGELARGRGLAGVFGGSEPVIDWLTVGQIGVGGTATVAAHVRDDFGVTGVHVEVYPPGYEEPEGGPGETPVVGVPTTTLALAGDDVYAATLTGLTTPGAYRVVGYAVDDEGNWALPRWTLVEGQGVEEQKLYLPLVLN